jgi:hypothetical protein
MSLGLHSDNADRSQYLELEVHVAGDGHELDVTWLPQDDMIRPRKVDHLKGEHLSVVVSHVSQGDRQIKLPEGGQTACPGPLCIMGAGYF